MTNRLCRGLASVAAVLLAGCATEVDLGPPQRIVPTAAPWASSSRAFTIVDAEGARNERLGAYNLTVQPTNGTGSAKIQVQYLTALQSVDYRQNSGYGMTIATTNYRLAPQLESWISEEGHRTYIATEGGSVRGSQVFLNGRETSFDHNGLTCVLVGQGIPLGDRSMGANALSQVFRGTICGDETIRREFGSYVRGGRVHVMQNSAGPVIDMQKPISLGRITLPDGGLKLPAQD